MSTLKHRYSGFTIVELIVVIAVIGILAAISVVGYGAWRDRTLQNAIQSDLRAAASAMESARTFAASYPLVLPSSFKAGDNVTIVWTSGDSTTYCLDGTAVGTSATFYIDSLTAAKGAQTGTCATRVITTPITASPASVTAVLNSSSQIAMSWGSTANATSYIAQCASDNAFIANPQSATPSGTSTTISGLTPGDVYCRVQGKNAAGKGPWSTTVTAQMDVTSGLVGWWKLNGNANDTSGNNNNGTIVGAVSTIGQAGVADTAYAFNGTGDYINLGNPTIVPSAFNPRTLCGWGKPNSAAALGWLASFGTASNARALYVGQYNGAAYGGAYGSDTFGSGFWASGMWKFVCVSYSGTVAVLYGNGAQLATSTVGWDLLRSVAYIGRQVNGGEYWSGLIDDVRLYNRALSASEVQALFLGGPR